MKLVKLVKFRDIWLHLVADVADGLAAESTFKALNPEDKQLRAPGCPRMRR